MRNQVSTVDLSRFIDQVVEVTYEDGSHNEGKVTKNDQCTGLSELHYAFFPNGGSWESYTKDGFVWSSKVRSKMNITHIKPLTMKKYEQLENQIKELQAEVERLKKEEEAGTKLPKNFSRKNAIAFLKNPNSYSLCVAFHWPSAPQGRNYWSCIAYSFNEIPSYEVPQEAIMIIQSWIIQSYENEYGV